MPFECNGIAQPPGADLHAGWWGAAVQTPGLSESVTAVVNLYVVATMNRFAARSKSMKTDFGPCSKASKLWNSS